MNIVGLTILAILLPALASGASREQNDLAQVRAAKADLEHGAELFQHCVQCHGADGGGTTNGSVPRIAGQYFDVLARQIIQFRNGKHWDMRMEGIATSHAILPRVQDIADVAGYVSSLSSDGRHGVGTGDYVEIGQAIYASGCASCHGASGEGDEPREVPRLAGQHAGYLARQIYDAVDNRRPALSASHRKRLAPLTFEEVLGITDYLSRIGWSPAAD
jgi:cytochrome c553